MEVDRKEGSFYIGEWRYDEKEGYGRLVLESGNIYDGNWVNSVAHGKGKIIYFHKFLTYKGKYYDSTGVLYTGDFECDLQHGYGREDYPDGKYYEGQFEQGVKNGYGEIYWATGDKYQGEFVENKIEGKGNSSI